MQFVAGGLLAADFSAAVAITEWMRAADRGEAVPSRCAAAGRGARALRLGGRQRRGSTTVM
jgi:hypothetical protein